MPFKSPLQRLADIIESIDAIESFSSGMAYADFVQDRQTIYAVTRALEINSEASRHLPEDLKDRHPEIDWRGIAAAGNVYRHEYEAVDDALVWPTVKHDLRPLRSVIVAEIERARAPSA